MSTILWYDSNVSKSTREDKKMDMDMEVEQAPLSCSLEEKREIILRVEEYKHQVTDFVSQNFDTLYPYFEDGERLEDVCDMIYDLMVDKQVYNPWRSGVVVKRVMFSDQDKAKYCPYRDCPSSSMGYDDIEHFRVCIYCGTLILPVTLNFLCPEYWEIRAMWWKWGIRDRKRDIQDYGVGYVVEDIATDVKRSIVRHIERFGSILKEKRGS